MLQSKVCINKKVAYLFFICLVIAIPIFFLYSSISNSKNLLSSRASQLKCVGDNLICCPGGIFPFDGSNADMAYNSGYCCFPANEGLKRLPYAHFEPVSDNNCSPKGSAVVSPSPTPPPCTPGQDGDYGKNFCNSCDKKNSYGACIQYGTTWKRCKACKSAKYNCWVDDDTCPNEKPVVSPIIESKESGNITVSAGGDSLPIDDDGVQVASPFLGQTQELQVQLETGQTLPVIVNFTQDSPSVIPSSAPAQSSSTTALSTPITTHVKAKVKCITINEQKITMACMACMVSDWAKISYQPQDYCSNDDYKNSQLKTISGTIILDGKDVLFMAKLVRTSKTVTTEEMKSFTVEKVVEGSGFWTSIIGADSKYQNQSLFTGTGFDVRLAEMTLSSDLTKNQLIVLLGTDVYGYYSLALDTNKNETTNGSCTPDNTLY